MLWPARVVPCGMVPLMSMSVIAIASMIEGFFNSCFQHSFRLGICFIAPLLGASALDSVSEGDILERSDSTPRVVSRAVHESLLISFLGL
jgi:hypothetical protein